MVGGWRGEGEGRDGGEVGRGKKRDEEKGGGKERGGERVVILDIG